MTPAEQETWEKIKRKLAIMIDRDDALIALNRKLAAENAEITAENKQLRRELEYWRERGMG